MNEEIADCKVPIADLKAPLALGSVIGNWQSAITRGT
jgi:hypothetical protein